MFFFFQAEDGIRDFCLSRGLGDVYKRQAPARAGPAPVPPVAPAGEVPSSPLTGRHHHQLEAVGSHGGTAMLRRPPFSVFFYRGCGKKSAVGRKTLWD